MLMNKIFFKFWGFFTDNLVLIVTGQYFQNFGDFLQII